MRLRHPRGESCHQPLSGPSGVICNLQLRASRVLSRREGASQWGEGWTGRWESDPDQAQVIPVAAGDRIEGLPAEDCLDLRF